MIEEKIEDLKKRLFYFENIGEFNQFIKIKLTNGKALGFGYSCKTNNKFQTVCGHNKFSWKMKENSVYDRICHGYIYKYGGLNIFCSKETVVENGFFCEFDKHIVLKCPECDYKGMKEEK